MCRDRSGLESFLPWIHALLPSANLLEFTSFLGSNFLSVSGFEKTPFLLEFSSIPLKSWSESSIPLVDTFTRSLCSYLQILVRFRLILIRVSLSLDQAASKNRASATC